MLFIHSGLSGGNDDGDGGENAPCGCEDGTNFCNYDSGSTGTCEPCDEITTIEDCATDVSGLPTNGVADCEMRCFPSDDGDHDTLTEPEMVCMFDAITSGAQTMSEADFESFYNSPESFALSCVGVTFAPTTSPTSLPTLKPSLLPSPQPSLVPTLQPTLAPTAGGVFCGSSPNSYDPEANNQPTFKTVDCSLNQVPTIAQMT